MDDTDRNFENDDPEFTSTPNDENSIRATPHTPADNTGNNHSNVMLR